MTIVRRLACCGLAALLCLLAAGCQQLPLFSRLPSFAEIAHELKPHRLHRWNRHPPPDRTTDW